MLRVQLPVPALHSFVRSGVLVNTSSGAALLCSARDDYKRSAQNVGTVLLASGKAMPAWFGEG